jgi:hypothetical protein
MLLQHLTKVHRMFGVGRKGTHPSQVIMSDHLCLGTLSIMFHARSPKGTLRSHQAIFPQNDGAFPAVQLPLPGEELLL